MGEQSTKRQTLAPRVGYGKLALVQGLGQYAMRRVIGYTPARRNELQLKQSLRTPQTCLTLPIDHGSSLSCGSACETMDSCQAIMNLKVTFAGARVTSRRANKSPC
jgi:hypothetical protein